MTEPRVDWERWQEEWQRGGSSQATVTAGLRQAAKARRELLFVQVIETVVGSVSVLLVALALNHAGNPFQAALGLAVGVGIGLIWAQRILMRRREHASKTAVSDDYLMQIRSLRVRQIRLAKFVWLVLVLDLVFLIPWWVIGNRVHSRRLTDLGAVATIWLPILGFLALFVWSLQLRRRAQLEVHDIDRMRTEYRDEPDAET
jgi:hypothetical protein